MGLLGGSENTDDVRNVILQTHALLFEHIEVDNTLTKNQFAVRKFHSTVTSLISSTDYWLQNIDNGSISMNIFLDLWKVFDIVNYQIRIEKLQY